VQMRNFRELYERMPPASREDVEARVKESLGEMDIAEHNRQVIQDALDRARPGETVNVDELPLRRDANGQTPVAVLFTVPRSAATLWKRQRSSPRTEDK
jgi:hypothetical protein